MTTEDKRSQLVSVTMRVTTRMQRLNDRLNEAGEYIMSFKG